MSAPGFWEWIFLAVLALLIFGPNRLPEVARGVGKAVAQFRREATSTLDELKRAAEYDELKGVAEEFRSTTADLRKSTSLKVDTAGSGATRMKPAAPARPPSAGPPPFDPDAT